MKNLIHVDADYNSAPNAAFAQVLFYLKIKWFWQLDWKFNCVLILLYQLKPLRIYIVIQKQGMYLLNQEIYNISRQPIHIDFFFQKSQDNSKRTNFRHVIFLWNFI